MRPWQIYGVRRGGAEGMVAAKGVCACNMQLAQEGVLSQPHLVGVVPGLSKHTHTSRHTHETISNGSL